MPLMSKPSLVITAFIKCIGSKRLIRILLIAQFLFAPRSVYLTFSVPIRYNTNEAGRSITSTGFIPILD